MRNQINFDDWIYEILIRVELKLRFIENMFLSYRKTGMKKISTDILSLFFKFPLMAKCENAYMRFA